MRINKFSIGRLRGVHVSSIVDKGIRSLLNLFIIIFFLQKDFTQTKRIKSIKSTKSTKCKQATLFLLDVFIRKKMLSFSVSHTKNTKSIKITKTQISEEATFLTLDIFYAHENAVFFVFVRL